MVYARERIAYAVNPSAALAYGYGVDHFDHSKPSLYNIAYAQYFLRETVRQDPKYPLAHHQLARVYFLRGDFYDALQEINTEINLEGDKNPNAYYVRGLIEGYSRLYDLAVADFLHFIQVKPENWAGYNDTAWVLMKAGRNSDAVGILVQGLSKHSGNAWLLNSLAIALYESGDKSGAQAVAARAIVAVQKLTPEDWSRADPGNDPRIAAEGLETFRAAAIENLHKIVTGAASSSIKMR